MNYAERFILKEYKVEKVMGMSVDAKATEIMNTYADGIPHRGTRLPSHHHFRTRQVNKQFWGKEPSFPHFFCMKIPNNANLW